MGARQELKVVHLGGNQLGDRILETLRDLHGDVTTVTSLEELEHATRGGVDWLVSAGFQHIVAPDLLARARRSCNVHISRLPMGRGKHPNVWMIVDGEPGGVTIHEMVAGLDEGPILAQRDVQISFADTARDLYLRLEDAAVTLFDDSWPDIIGGHVEPRAQEGPGSHHLGAEFFRLVAIDLDEEVTWRHAFNVLRAATFPPHQNLVVEVDGRRFQLEARVTEVQ